jgi:tRNA(Ile)-lysidine synthase
MNRIQLAKKFLRRFPPDERYLIGVSGGRDSVALLRWLIEGGYKKVIVCHLNHHLRGRASNSDAQFVQRLVRLHSQKPVGQALRLPNSKAGKRGACPTIARVDLELGSVNVRSLAAKKRLSIETAAREARYKFFAKIAKRRRCYVIFLAHHADDLVETFLINLFRGSGTTGLGAMREISKRQVGRTKLTLVRPLIGIWRHEIDEYVKAKRLTFREDESNQDLAALRNRIRRRVIPYLEKTVGRNIREAIWRAATIAAEEESWIETQLPNKLEPNAKVPANAALAVVELRGLPMALQRRAILKWLRAQQIANLGFEDVENVRSLLDHEIAKVNLPRDRHVRRRAGKIFIE